MLFGHADPWAASIDLATLNGSNGFRVNGSVGGVGLGAEVASGDLNNDGIDDFAVSGVGWEGGSLHPNIIYAVYGKAGGWTTPITLNDAFVNSGNGFRIDSAADIEMGYSLAIGNFTNSSKKDLAVGASRNSPNGTNSGSVYLYYGQGDKWNPINSTVWGLA